MAVVTASFLCCPGLQCQHSLYALKCGTRVEHPALSQFKMKSMLFTEGLILGIGRQPNTPGKYFPGVSALCMASQPPVYAFRHSAASPSHFPLLYSAFNTEPSTAVSSQQRGPLAARPLLHPPCPAPAFSHGLTRVEASSQPSPPPHQICLHFGITNLCPYNNVLGFPLKT